MRDYCNWILHSRSHYENHGIYSVLYMGEVLGDKRLVDEALRRNVRPAAGYGRTIFDSGIGLMLYDIQTNGAVRDKLKAWAALDSQSALFFRGYLQSVGAGNYQRQIRADYDRILPTKRVRAQYFGWAKRRPRNFRDAFSADVMPDGLWHMPRGTMEKLAFDAPGGIGNNPSRSQFVHVLMYGMKALGRDR
jgi:hypothetical protein